MSDDREDDMDNSKEPQGAMDARQRKDQSLSAEQRPRLTVRLRGLPFSTTEVG